MTKPTDDTRFARDCVMPALGSSIVAVIAPTATSLLFASTSYFGVQDDAVATAAQERYHSYIVAVLASLGGVACSEIVLIFLVLLGPSLFLRLRRPALWSTRRRVWVLHGLAAMLVTFLYFGWVADAHPGLFLSSLSNFSLSYPLLALARYLAPLAAAASLGTYGYVAFRAPLRVRVGIVGLVMVTSGAITVGRHLAKKYEHRPYREPVVVTKPDAPKPAKPKTIAPRKRATKPSVLWVGVDSLRPDRIDPEHTPNLSRLLGESVYFPRTLVTVPRTGPSWVSALTSMAPLTNGVETMFPDGEAGKLARIALPAHLTARGYRTAVFSDYAGEFFGRVNLGFQLSSVPEVELREISGQLVLSATPLVLAHAGTLYSQGPFMRHLLGDPLSTLLRGLTSFTHPPVLATDLSAWLLEEHDAPFFALLFYSQPHFPYASNGEYYRRYHASGSSSSIAFGRDATNETPITSDADLQQIDGLYRGALAESDHALGALLDQLQAQGELDDTIVIVTADHGEGLYDCATCVGHGDNLTSMLTLTTPLAIRLPKGRYPRAQPTVINTQVSALDIYPTILSLVGEAPIVIHEGVALLDAAGAPTHLPESRVLFAETGEWLWSTAAVPKDRLEYPPITGMATLEHGRIVIDRKYLPVIRSAKQRMAIRWPFKLVYEPHKSGVERRLYKVDEDPFDTKDIAAREPLAFEQLSQALDMEVLRHHEILSVRGYFVSRPPQEEE